jgi:uncharacterized protein YkuJ
MTDDLSAASDQHLERLLGTLRLPAVPAPVHDRLLSMYATHRAALEPTGLGAMLTAVRRRIEAVLQTDTWGGMVLAGARGAGGDRQLLFSADGVDVTIHIQPGATGTAHLDGMVLHADGGDHRDPVRVERSGEVVAAITTTDEGTFRVRDLPRGDYTLVIELDDLDVVVGPIELVDA